MSGTAALLDGSNYVVYGLRDPSTDELRYVGMTGNEDLRRKQYERCGGADSNTPLGEWLVSLKQAGLAPKFCILVRITGPCAQWARHVCEFRMIEYFTSKTSRLLNIQGNKKHKRRKAVST